MTASRTRRRGIEAPCRDVASSALAVASARARVEAVIMVMLINVREAEAEGYRLTATSLPPSYMRNEETSMSRVLWRTWPVSWLRWRALAQVYSRRGTSLAARDARRSISSIDNSRAREPSMRNACICPWNQRGPHASSHHQKNV